MVLEEALGLQRPLAHLLEVIRSVTNFTRWLAEGHRFRLQRCYLSPHSALVESQSIDASLSS